MLPLPLTEAVPVGIHSRLQRLVRMLRPLLAGLLLPLGFAPFHLPGLVFLGIAFLILVLRGQSGREAFISGLLFGLGYFGFGVSWVFVSVHEYGHLNMVASALITAGFTTLLALLPASTCALWVILARTQKPLFSSLLFAAIWTLSEALRAAVMPGFPWLLLAGSQVDTPPGFLLPVIGIFGTGFMTCFAALLLAHGMDARIQRRQWWLLSGVAMILLPSALQHISWTTLAEKPLTVGVVQANLSMRDKWDETLFWELMAHYEKKIAGLLGTELIILPESAIPLPESWISDVLARLDHDADAAGSALLLGIPRPANENETLFYNSLLGVGRAHGSYLKQQLVPFGEYIPSAFSGITARLGIPEANILPGSNHQKPVRIHGHPIASLICYELGYGEVLRRQLPRAEWIVSVSDDGWFGKSLALYQHLQMAQALSLQAARYQVVANNDGLSAIIDPRGRIVDSLPAFSEGVLKSHIYPATGTTPWIRFGDAPALILATLLLLIALLPLAVRIKREYSWQPES
ncbi:apolipoprotein N-acyltransferase [Legionella geestiana]|uniref:Apolipoprotein N-acyltransferase n=1 Tax=Legionella geestiana TaxID=45065 RepID=A0A0W0U8C6_9GAMM|nr:apolipoprotein N-acyltransferase [Legionella geestiana]KTD04184.1 apolipoprotein N-acyltransferase [Legionella geestiana]STX53712.1 apolipoprotein N-acyltransferase [Legionella geestiana]